MCFLRFVIQQQICNSQRISLDTVASVASKKEVGSDSRQTFLSSLEPARLAVGPTQRQSMDTAESFYGRAAPETCNVHFSAFIFEVTNEESYMSASLHMSSRHHHHHHHHHPVEWKDNFRSNRKPQQRLLPSASQRYSKYVVSEFKGYRLSSGGYRPQTLG